MRLQTPRTGLARLAWAGLLSAGLALACASPGLPPPRARNGAPAETIRRAQELYLYPERIDRRLLIGALDTLERRLHEVRFEEDGESGWLWVGSERVYVPLPREVDPEEFDEILGGAVRFVEERMDAEDLPDEDEEGDLEVIALQGALASMDRYSTIFSGRSSEDFQIRFSGHLKGIGSRIGRRDGELIAIKVFPDSPALRAGLRDGDVIVQIDGESTQPLTVGEAVGRIRGEPGSSVVLSVLREGARSDIPIERGDVQIPTVETRLIEPGIGYALVESMSRSTVQEFHEKVVELGPLQGLILDLRGNTGGSMQTATQLADLFMARRTIVRVVDRRDPEGKSPRSRARARPRVVFDVPIVILVDPHTASAAEIVAGALAPLRRVTLVGQTTFGKGVIQRVLALPDLKLLKLTVAEYRLSGNRIIHEKGIDPDIALLPVSEKQLGRLANVGPNTVPYVRTPDEEDNFPISVATLLLKQEMPEALRGIRDQADQGIKGHLDALAIGWNAELLPDPLPSPLRLQTESTPLVAGQTTVLRVRVENPNDFPIPALWVALDPPLDYLSSKLVALGTLPAGGEVHGEIELTVPDGLTVPEAPVSIHLASGSRHLQTEETLLRMTPHVPQIEITVERLDSERIKVIVHNRGRFGVGRIRIDVPDATRSHEALGPGATIERELRLSGEIEHVDVTLSGSWVERRIEIPVPEQRVEIVPPDVVVERAGLVRRSKVRMRATAPEGLGRAWIALNGQKQGFVDWEGQRSGQLETDLAEGANHIVTRVETLSGVAVIESQDLTAN